MSAAEAMLEIQLKAVGLIYQREFKAIPNRKYRFDFLCCKSFIPGTPEPVIGSNTVLVEVQGGQWATQNSQRSAHVGGFGMERDCEKASLAAVYGYRLIQVTPGQVKSGQALQWIEQALAIVP